MPSKTHPTVHHPPQNGRDRDPLPPASFSANRDGHPPNERRPGGGPLGAHASITHLKANHCDRRWWRCGYHRHVGEGTIADGTAVGLPSDKALLLVQSDQPSLYEMVEIGEGRAGSFSRCRAAGAQPPAKWAITVDPLSKMLQVIARAQRLNTIVAQYKRLPAVIHAHIADGAKARDLTRMIAAVSDAILEKVVQMTIEQLGVPPVRFVFLTMGSQGRSEQTLKTDQDNGILYEDVLSNRRKVQDYFAKLGEAVCHRLNQIGYENCAGGVMASTPRWCQPLAVWKSYFSNWIHHAAGEDLLRASIFFDFRGTYGDRLLSEDLRQHLCHALNGWSGFFHSLTQNALQFKPPLAHFRKVVLAFKGRSRHTLDLKSTLMPIVDMVRIYALKNGIAATNTWDRIQQLRSQRVLSRRDAGELENAYSALMHLRLLRQVTAEIDEKAKPDNWINLNQLTCVDRAMVKEILRQERKFQAKLELDFMGTCALSPA